MKKIKTFEDACKTLGYSDKVPSFKNAPEKHQKALEAHYKLIIITEAINGSWQPDWADRSQYKYQLWPDIIKDESKSSGFGLACVVFGCGAALSLVGSRLCFKSFEAAKYCFNTFKGLWEDYFLIDK